MNSNAVRISELASTSESQGKAISELAANVDSRAKEIRNELHTRASALEKKTEDIDARAGPQSSSQVLKHEYEAHSESPLPVIQHGQQAPKSPCPETQT